MRSLIVIQTETARSSPEYSDQPTSSPKVILQEYGYFVCTASTLERAKVMVNKADAAVLDLPVGELKGWGKELLWTRSLPLIWWCSASSASESLEACEENVTVDGILTPSMSEQELHWALHFSSRQYFERKQWQSERAQMMAQLEDRKWIDMAKGILSKMKNISEAEAYDFLRKQAMNERKRIVDVATSIVKVYQLLKESK
ncbi:ANTAR domain-containing response regulator [Paenibacillus beijingensis]|uniref:Histidine kinase n=1 Tax=Paenibacillus beijingensis TaxID=1126833 RepID=A0A0D5NKY6_9BACL|nr:ANTAR domain-containing protein [Paenibacillus beijingensis]AJY76014.1 histidine kinase [Paenibacillus beijingensis]